MHHSFLFLVFLLFITGCNKQKYTADKTYGLPSSGPYLGQELPGEEPVLFAPGIVSTPLFERDLAMSPDGREIYFCVSAPGYLHATIMVTRLTENGWSPPKVMEHMDQPGVLNYEPCISHDGSRFFFVSNRPDSLAGETGRGDQDIWVMERNGEGWSRPVNLGPPVNSEAAEYFPSVTNTGRLYFTRAEKGSPIHHIYRSDLSGNGYLEPELLPSQINTGKNRYNAFVSQDESWVIIPALGRDDSFGGTDYYISFRNPDDTWEEPVNLGPEFNSAWDGEYSASLSPDGKYLFFMSTRVSAELLHPDSLSYGLFTRFLQSTGNGNSDIYWVNVSVLEKLRLNLIPDEK